MPVPGTTEAARERTRESAVRRLEKVIARLRIEKDEALQERIQDEREKITAEMDKVQQRGLGPNFTQGMKDNLLKRWQDQLDRLNSDPEAYFSGQ